MVKKSETRRIGLVSDKGEEGGKAALNSYEVVRTMLAL